MSMCACVLDIQAGYTLKQPLQLKVLKYVLVAEHAKRLINYEAIHDSNHDM